MKKYAGKIKELDALVQKWAAKQRSEMSRMPAQCGHHYIGRKEMITRWDLRNIVPLTFDEHRLLHDGVVDWDIGNPFRRQFLINQKNKGIKQYLLENKMSVDEFMQDCKQKILEALNEKP